VPKKQKCPAILSVAFPTRPDVVEVLHGTHRFAADGEIGIESGGWVRVGRDTSNPVIDPHKHPVVHSPAALAALALASSCSGVGTEVAWRCDPPPPMSKNHAMAAWLATTSSPGPDAI